MNGWTPSKIVLFVIAVLLIFYCGYLMLNQPLFRLPPPSFTIYENEIVNIDSRNPIRPIEVPYKIVRPFTISYWMNFRLPNQNVREKKSKGLMYIGNGQAATYKNNVLLLQSLKLDSSERNEDTLGYQMVNEIYMNNSYMNTNDNGMVRYRVNEWVFYTYVYLENTVQIYQNGNLMENVLYRIMEQPQVNGGVVDNFKVYFSMPELLRDDFEDIPKKIHNVKWYNYVLKDRGIRQMYEEEKKVMDMYRMMERNEGNVLNEICKI